MKLWLSGHSQCRPTSQYVQFSNPPNSLNWQIFVKFVASSSSFRSEKRLNRKEAFSQLLYISLPVIIQMFSCSDTMFDSRLLLMYYCRCNGIFIRYHFYQVLPFSHLNYSDFWNIWARRLQSIFIWCNPVASFKFAFAEYCWIFGLITVFLNVKTPPPKKKNRI